MKKKFIEKVQEKNVLFQKMGLYWYAFTVADGSGEELLLGKLPEGVDPREVDIDLVEMVSSSQLEEVSEQENRLLEKR